MNWLTHIYLAAETQTSILGNFLGDFIIYPQWQKKYDETIKKGIKIHIELDKFGTCHPIFKRSCDRISKENRTFAILLIDIFYDHFLAKNWNEYSDTQIETFVKEFYKTLVKKKKILPEKLVQIMPKMIEENWLLAYRELWGIQNALNRVSSRLSIPNTLGECLEELTGNCDDLETDSKDFFSAMREEFIRN